MIPHFHETHEAVVRNLSLIGEAASHIPEEITARYPNIPWREIRAIRNIMVHEYFGVDTKTIWETINQDLPPLISQLQQVLNENQDAS